MRTRTRIILLFLLSGFLSVLAFFLLLNPLNSIYTTFFDTRVYTEHDIATFFDRVHRQIPQEEKKTDVYDQAGRIVREHHPQLSGVIIQVLDSQGKVHHTIGVQDDRLQLEEAGLKFDRYSLADIGTLESQVNSSQRYIAEMELVPLIPDSPNLGSLLCVITEERAQGIAITVREQGNKILLLLFFSGLVTVFLVTLTVIFLGTRSLLHRFTILEQGLSAVLEGNYEYRLPEGGSDELGFLCRSFNTMLDGLAGQRAAREQAEAEKRAIIAGLSHDLRTPLASIMGYAESIRDNPDETAGEIREQAEIIHSKSVYMESLIQELLDFSFSEYSSTSPQLEVFDCNEFVRTIIIGFLPRMREKAISLEVELPEQPYWVRADKNMLARAFENLLSNAIRYVPSDGSLWVAAHRGDTQRSEPAGGADTVRIAIANNGPPIAEEDREHIFENFYRGEPSRHGRGLGLGLTIARNILRSLDGELLLERSDKTATVFTVILPVCNQHP